MASNGNDRGRFLTTGGVLSIVVGVFMMYLGALSFFNYGDIHPISWLVPLFPRFYSVLYSLTDLSLTDPSLWQMITGGASLVLGIIALAGGISAVRRRRFGLSLAGAICALPSGSLGVLAIIFVSLARREFRAKD
jgi:hypothetical protein